MTILKEKKQPVKENGYTDQILTVTELVNHYRGWKIETVHYYPMPDHSTVYIRNAELNFDSSNILIINPNKDGIIISLKSLSSIKEWSNGNRCGLTITTKMKGSLEINLER